MNSVGEFILKHLVYVFVAMPKIVTYCQLWVRNSIQIN